MRIRWKPPTIFARLATSLGWCSYLAPAVHECSVISQDYRTSITKVFMTLFLKKGGAIAPLAPPLATPLMPHLPATVISPWACSLGSLKTKRHKFTALCIIGRVLYVRTPTDIDTRKRTRTNADARTQTHGRRLRRRRKQICVRVERGRENRPDASYLRWTFKDLRDVLYVYVYMHHSHGIVGPNLYYYGMAAPML